MAGEDSAIEHLALVTGRSDKAEYLGRRLVRDRAASAREYALVVDAYVRRRGERFDAVIIESAARGGGYRTSKPFLRCSKTYFRRLQRARRSGRSSISRGVSRYRSRPQSILMIAEDAGEVIGTLQLTFTQCQPPSRNSASRSSWVSTRS